MLLGRPTFNFWLKAWSDSYPWSSFIRFWTRDSSVVFTAHLCIYIVLDIGKILFLFLSQLLNIILVLFSSFSKMALALKQLSESISTEQILIKWATVLKFMFAMQMSLGTLYAGKICMLTL